MTSERENLYPAIQMTNACNKQCRACLRSANGRKDALTGEDFRKYLADLRTVGGGYRILHQFVTGGEPTIWKDAGEDISDVLVALFELGIIDNITMPSNGKLFEESAFCREFFGRLSKRIDKHLIVGISIADYQENLGETGYIAMDNLLSLREDPGMKIVPIIMVTLSADDDTDRRLKKIYPNVYQRVVPLAPLGNASDMKEECPSLSLAGNDKQPLGSFLPHFKQDVCGKLGIAASEFDAMPNARIMNEMSLHSHCGSSPFIDASWHYCLPFKDDRRFDLCGIGQMQPTTLRDFVASTPLLGGIRSHGLLAAVQERRDNLSPESREKLATICSPASRVSVAYRGCMVCKELYDAGIIGELTGGASAL